MFTGHGILPTGGLARLSRDRRVFTRSGILPLNRIVLLDVACR